MSEAIEHVALCEKHNRYYDDDENCDICMRDKEISTLKDIRDEWGRLINTRADEISALKLRVAILEAALNKIISVAQVPKQYVAIAKQALEQALAGASTMNGDLEKVKMLIITAISEWEIEMRGPLKDEAKPKLMECEINNLRKSIAILDKLMGGKP